MERVDDCEEFCQVVDLFSFSRIAVKSDLRQSLITFNRFEGICKNVTSSINSGLLSTELMPKLVAIVWKRSFGSQMQIQVSARYTHVQFEVDDSQQKQKPPKVNTCIAPHSYSSHTESPMTSIISSSGGPSSFLPLLLSLHPSREGISHVLMAAESTSASSSTLGIYSCNNNSFQQNEKNNPRNTWEAP